METAVCTEAEVTPGKMRIVHVDDNVRDRTRVSDALRADGVELKSVSGIRDFKKCIDDLEEPELIILDIKFRSKTMTGPLVSSAKTGWPDAAIMILTNYAEDPSAVQAHEDYGIQVLDKTRYVPDRSALRAAVRTVLQDAEVEVPERIRRQWDITDEFDHVTEEYADTDVLRLAGRVVDYRDDGVEASVWEEWPGRDSVERRIVLPVRFFDEESAVMPGDPFVYRVFWRQRELTTRVEWLPADHGHEVRRDLSDEESQVLARIRMRNAARGWTSE